MEGKKTITTSSSSIADELFGRKDDDKSSASGIFSSVFHGPASRDERDYWQSELFGSSKKQGEQNKAWDLQSRTKDGNIQDGKSENQSIHSKDRYSGGEAGHTSNLSSSLYYGGPDICSSISSSQTYGSERTDKKDGEDDPDNMASRGNWWQGSLYY